MSTFNTRLETAKEKISELEDIAEKNYAEGGTKRQRDEKRKRLRVQNIELEGVAYIQSEFQKERTQRTGKKDILRNNSIKFLRIISDTNTEIMEFQ